MSATTVLEMFVISVTLATTAISVRLHADCQHIA